MKQFKHILKKIFILPPWATVLISLPSFIFVFYVLGMEVKGVPAYVSYGLSAYALVITATGFTKIVKTIRRGIDNHPVVKKLLDHPISGRYITDIAFREEVSLYPSLFMNMLYAAIKMISGILYDSVWLITLSIYYILLAVMYFLVLTSARKMRNSVNIADEFRRYRICGVLLAFMNLVLSGMILFLVRQDGGYEYPGVLIYVMAMYAFYAVIMAVINIVKFRKHGSPILSAAKVISLTTALASMLALETAMLSQFGQNDDYLFRQIMTASTGAAVCGFVFIMSVYMIVHATKELKKL